MPGPITAMQRRMISQQIPYPQGISAGGGSRSGAATAAQRKVVETLVNPEVWTMYDTAIISPGAAGLFAAFANFATVTSNIAFFSTRTVGGTSSAITSMTTTSGYVDFPFKGYGMGVEVWCDVDAPSGASQFTARQFVEAVTQGAGVTLTFATDPKLIVPVSDLPCGGGVVPGIATDTRAAGANQTAGNSTNGMPSVQARVLWKDYILFRGKDQPFFCNLTLSPVALARINALTPLTGNFSAGIRIKFWGYRGKALVTGSPFRG